MSSLDERGKVHAKRHLGGHLHPLITVLVLAWVTGEGVWIAYLSYKLPETYTTHRWTVAWVGLDVAQVLTLIGLLVTGWRRHRGTILLSAAGGVLLLVDTWFDVITSHGASFAQSLVTGVIQTTFGVALLWFSIRQLGHLVRTGEVATGLGGGESVLQYQIGGTGKDVS